MKDPVKAAEKRVLKDVDVAIAAVRARHGNDLMLCNTALDILVSKLRALRHFDAHVERARRSK